MTLDEFSNEFDILVDSYRRFKKFDSLELLDSLEFNEYEKSIFLTKALELLILSLYNGKNSFLDSFEKTEEMRRYLSNLVKTDIITEKSEGIGLSDNSIFFTLPSNLWFITYESVRLIAQNDCIKSANIIVYPITLDEFYKILKNPFRQSNYRKALRLDCGNNLVEIISKYPVESYLVRYMIKPTPIILTDLSRGLTINNVSTKSECMLHLATHRTILELAVRMAIASKINILDNK